MRQKHKLVETTLYESYSMETGAVTSSPDKLSLLQALVSYTNYFLDSKETKTLKTVFPCLRQIIRPLLLTSNSHLHMHVI